MMLFLFSLCKTCVADSVINKCELSGCVAKSLSQLIWKPIGQSKSEWTAGSGGQTFRCSALRVTSSSVSSKWTPCAALAGLF